MGIARKDKNIIRLHRRIDIRERLERNSVYCGDCIIWCGSATPDGYGRVGRGGKKDGISPTITAHRAAYLAYIGDIPNGLELDHVCQNRLCINPGHLEVVTHQENTRRAWVRRIPSTHCKNGHLRTTENTYSARGWQECKECQAITNKRYHGNV